MGSIIFDTMCKKLAESNVSCIALNYEDYIEVRLGFNYPDCLFEVVWDISVELGIPNKVEVCADSAGGPLPLEKRIINGGLKRYF